MPPRLLVMTRSRPAPQLTRRSALRRRLPVAIPMNERLLIDVAHSKPTVRLPAKTVRRIRAVPLALGCGTA